MAYSGQLCFPVKTCAKIIGSFFFPFRFHVKEKVCKGALHIPTYVFRYLQIRECERLKKISPMPSRYGCSMIQP